MSGVDLGHGRYSDIRRAAKEAERKATAEAFDRSIQAGGLVSPKRYEFSMQPLKLGNAAKRKGSFDPEAVAFVGRRRSKR